LSVNCCIFPSSLYSTLNVEYLPKNIIGNDYYINHKELLTITLSHLVMLFENIQNQINCLTFSLQHSSLTLLPHPNCALRLQGTLMVINAR
jgi:hypothetical protein